MKKHMSFLTGLLVCFFVFMFTGCPSQVNSDDGGGNKTPVDNKEYVTVTFDATEKGYYVYESQQTKTFRVEKGNVCVESNPPSIKSGNYYYLYQFDAYYKLDETEPFDFSTPITEDITLVAKYNIKAVEITKIATNFDGTKISISPKHSAKYAYPEIENFNYSLTVIDTVTNQKVFTDEQSIVDMPSSIEVTGLTHAKKYLISIEAIYNEEHSKPVQSFAYPAKKVDILVLMYMDGDNDLNNPIFLDLNEAEFGLSKISEDNQNRIAILALWDGWAGNGKDALIGSSGTKLLELGADEGELLSGDSFTVAAQKLSDKTQDLSDRAEWLASGEVDMSDKQTLVNFLTFAKTMYYVQSAITGPNNTILQFSNHGGGPRSLNLPKTAILPNGKEIKLNGNSGRRAMCWDEGSGGKTFLKTSDISSALEETGYKDFPFGIIIEDVCLGGSIEEVYEVKDYTSYFLASPNNVPGTGMDYTILVEAINKYVLTTNYANLKSVATALCEKYKTDYTISSETWTKFLNEYIEDLLAKNEAFKDEYNAFSDSEKKEFMEYLKQQLSLSLSDMNTISLIETSGLFNTRFCLNKVVSEILNNGNKYCTKFFYDSVNNTITTTVPDPSSTTILPIERTWVLQDQSLRPYNNINYQGTYSWLYDLGTVLEGMYYISDAEGWTDLSSALNELAGNINKAVIFAWRDGCDYPTYSTQYDSDYYPYSYGWLGGKGSNANKSYLHYGLTISGETIKGTLNGDVFTIENGDYPSWYTELKFGQECKWNDLLKVWFPQ